MRNTQPIETIHFTVKGMSCGGCVRSVQKILSTLNGVIDADVHVGHVSVTIDPSRVDGKAIQQALKAGEFVAEFQN
jgi:copper chaperone CopZ